MKENIDKLYILLELKLSYSINQHKLNCARTKKENYRKMFHIPYHRENILFREAYSDASALQKKVIQKWKILK